MKTPITLLIAIAVCVSVQVMAQEKKPMTLYPNNSTKPLFILKVDNKCLEVDSAVDGITIESIDPKTIESIDVFKEKDKTVDQYGLKAQFGVVIIHFKEFGLLSKELQSKFEECK